MKNSSILLCFITVLISFYSCTDFGTNYTISSNNDTDCIDDSISVNESMLKTIVNRFVAQRPSLNGRTFHNIETIKDESRIPAMYVVNFENNNGYIIVSASKNYYPILAYSDSGNFHTTDGQTPKALKDWQDYTIKNINRYKNASKDSLSSIRKQWSIYEEPKKLCSLNTPLTRSFENDPDYIMMHYVNEWQLNNYNIIHLEEPNWTTGDEAMDNTIRNIAFSNTYAEYDENWQHYSILVYKDYEVDNTVPNFVLSTWDQSLGYNVSFPPCDGLTHIYTGCAIIAVGQVMRYFEKPLYSSSFPFNLSTLPLNNATTQTSDFLLNVFNKYDNIEYNSNGTSTTLVESKNVLTKFGYTSKIGNCNSLILRSNIYNRKPVIMRGESHDPDSVGHQWVVSGLDESSYYTKYELYTFTTQSDFTKVWEYETNHIFSTEFFYMNWGWGGYNNGYFNLGTMKFPGYNDNISNLKMIYDICY